MPSRPGPRACACVLDAWLAARVHVAFLLVGDDGGDLRGVQAVEVKMKPPGGSRWLAVHDVAGDLRPLLFGEHPVLRGGPDRAVPYRPLESARAQRGLWLLEQPGQAAEVAAAVLTERGFQFGRVAPASHEVRVGVLFVAARPVQVLQQPGDPAAARADLADHWRSCLRSSSAAWSSR